MHLILYIFSFNGGTEVKQIIKNIISCGIVMVLTVGLIIWLGRIVRPLNTDVAVKAIETFHEIPDNTMEVIGYGSSHMWRGLNTMEMYDKYGIGAYNYGCNWQHINTTLLFLEDSLRTQSPKVILIETYLVNELLKDININGEIYYTREISNFDGKQKYLNQCFGKDMERYLSYYMPLCAFHDNWINIEQGSFMENSYDVDFFSTMGYWYFDEVTPIEIDESMTMVNEELSDEALTILNNIIKICNEKDIEIIFYTAPFSGVYKYGNAMEKFAKENNCKYFNMFEMMDEVGIDCNTDFMDTDHLNNNGAIKVADFLGEYIVNNYQISDMREVSGNIWEEMKSR